MANTPNLHRNGASLLANFFGVGFIDWSDGLSTMQTNLSASEKTHAPSLNWFLPLPDTHDGERGRTGHGDFLIANDLFFATSFFKVA